MNNPHTAPTEPIAGSDQNPFQVIFEQMYAQSWITRRTKVRERKEKLRRMLHWIETNSQRLQDALLADFRKHPEETVLTEQFPVRAEIHEILRNLDAWMRPRRIPTPLHLAGTVSHIRQEAKGLVLIISPWNFPFLLTLRPLASAIAAGNTVIIKTSEHAPHSAACMEQLVQDVFEPDEVRLIQGDATVAQRLLKLPFNHIFFTGSTVVGKIVMEAASRHLSSVTLELGGKSPVIIVKDADVTKAAADIAWGRTLNSGQACVAPDYVLIHEDHLAAFVAQYQQQITRMYGSDPAQDSSLARIINLHHFRRLRGLLEDAVRQGAQITVGGQTNEADLYIAPTLLTRVTPQMQVMQEEIFGPILPVMTFKDRDEAVSQINTLPRPLSMYIFARQAPDVDYLLSRIMCGDVVINNCVIHFGHSKLGVGGSNNSGIGKGLGHACFLEFTHERGVMQHKMLDFSMLFPSYNNKLTRTILRWYYKLG